MLRRAIATDRPSIRLCVPKISSIVQSIHLKKRFLRFLYLPRFYVFNVFLRCRGHILATAWLLVIQRFKLFYFPSLFTFFNVCYGPSRLTTIHSRPRQTNRQTMSRWFMLYLMVA